MYPPSRASPSSPPILYALQLASMRFSSGLLCGCRVLIRTEHFCVCFLIGLQTIFCFLLWHGSSQKPHILFFKLSDPTFWLHKKRFGGPDQKKYYFIRFFGSLRNGLIFYIHQLLSAHKVTCAFPGKYHCRSETYPRPCLSMSFDAIYAGNTANNQAAFDHCSEPQFIGEKRKETPAFDTRAGDLKRAKAYKGSQSLDTCAQMPPPLRIRTTQRAKRSETLHTEQVCR